MVKMREKRKTTKVTKVVWVLKGTSEARLPIESLMKVKADASLELQLPSAHNVLVYQRWTIPPETLSYGREVH